MFTTPHTLAPYATKSEASRGRFYGEPSCAPRSEFQRDRDRIIHSTAFRRLEYKTQVFINHEGDHYRTRLTHSLEVAQLSRSLARELQLDEDLAEALALAHDLGHPPFGHAGEDALDEMMQPHGGFDHNAQTIRLLTHLEQKYIGFDGLNLTWECLEGIAKHNGPITGTLPRALEGYNQQHDLELTTHAGLEAQIAALCDDIAYHSHDLEDGIRAGLLNPHDLVHLPLIGGHFHQFLKSESALEIGRITHEVRRRLISFLCSDLVENTLKRVKDSGVQTAEDVRNYPEQLAVFSDQVEKANREVKTYLYEHMYKHYKVNRMTSKGKRIVQDLFTLLHREPNCLPDDWRTRGNMDDETERAHVIADYIAGMTDRYALEEHRRLFDLSYKVIGSGI